MGGNMSFFVVSFPVNSHCYGDVVLEGGLVLPLGLLLLFLAVQHGLWDLSSLTRDGIGAHGSRKQQVLTTGPPRNSQK